MTIRVLYNYFLYLLGLGQMLPGDILRGKCVKECGEPMVTLTPRLGLFLDANGALCRYSVAEKLKRVARRLSEEGMGLYIFELYRTPEQQKIRFQRTYQHYSDKFSDKDELDKYVRRSTAGVGGGHQTGGAVDLTLCDKDGIPLDMGSIYPVKCPEMATNFQLSSTIMERRKLLCRIMREEGFANYPGEWWHFSYGDQLWAAYRHKRCAIYGVVGDVELS